MLLYRVVISCELYQRTHQMVNQEKITNSTLGGSWIVEQYSSVYQIMVIVRTIKAIVAHVSCAMSRAAEQERVHSVSQY